MYKIKETFLYEKDINVDILRKDKIKLEYFIREHTRYKKLSDDRFLTINKILVVLRDFQNNNPDIILTELENNILKLLK